MKTYGWYGFLAVLTVATGATGSVYEVYTGGKDFILCTQTLEKGIPEQIHAFDNQRMTVAVHADKIYWANRTSGIIYRSNTDGSMIEEIITGLTLPINLHVNGSIGKIFWSSSGFIMCANLDGTTVENVVGTGADISTITTHAATAKVYWFQYTSISAGGIKRANLDGTTIEDVTPTGLPAYPGMARSASLFAVSDSIYFNSDLFEWGAIYKMNLDGTNPLPVISGGYFKTLIFVSEAANTLCWVESFPSPDINVQRSFLDNTTSENVAVVPFDGSLFGMTCTNDSLFWSSGTGIFRQHLPHTRILTQVTREVMDIKAVFAPGASDGFIYWSEMNLDSLEMGTGAIYRIRSDGTNRETIHEGLNSVVGIEVDEDNDFLYWADIADYKIYRSTLAGEDITIAHASANLPFYLALDMKHDFLYWTVISSPYMEALDLDSGIHSTIITNNDPRALAVDPHSQKIYYTGEHFSGVWQINTDGTDDTEIFASPSSRTNFALDTIDNVLYWIRDDGLKRLSTDGFTYEELRNIGGSCLALRILNPSLTIIGSRHASLGSLATLRVSGLPPLVGNVTYEWYRNSTLVTEAASDTYTILSAGYEHAGIYHVMVMDESKTIYISSPFELIVTDSPMPATNMLLLGVLAIALTGLGAKHMRKQN